MKSSDIYFTMNSGTYNGETYKFTLAKENGKKMWDVQRLFEPAPSMYKEQIDVGIALRESGMNLSGAKELKYGSSLIDQLEIVTGESTYVTMMGLDGVSRDVRIDSTGFSIEQTIDEQGKPGEYVAKMRLWSMHQ